MYASISRRSSHLFGFSFLLCLVRAILPCWLVMRNLRIDWEMVMVMVRRRRGLQRAGLYEKSVPEDFGISVESCECIWMHVQGACRVHGGLLPRPSSERKASCE